MNRLATAALMVGPDGPDRRPGPPAPPALDAAAETVPLMLPALQAA